MTFLAVLAVSIFLTSKFRTSGIFTTKRFMSFKKLLQKNVVK